MSTDYFGALLRSAGRAVAGAPVGPAPASTAADELREINVESEARSSTDSPAAAGPLTLPSSVQGTPPAGRTLAAAVVPAAVPAVATAGTAPASAAPAGAFAVPSPPGPDAVDLPPPALHGTVLAALSWVASDPQAQAQAQTLSPSKSQGRAAPGSVSWREPLPSATENSEPPAHMTQEKSRDDPWAGTLARPAIDAGVVPAPAPVQSSVERMQLPLPLTATPPDESWHEELVEITIGAIHLRVDAPSPATVAQSPPPSAPAPMPAAPPARSPLSRRALYRI